MFRAFPLLLLVLPTVTVGAVTDLIDASKTPAPAVITMHRNGRDAPTIDHPGIACYEPVVSTYSMEVRCLVPDSTVPGTTNVCASPRVTVSVTAGGGTEGWASCGDIGDAKAKTAYCGTQAVLVVASRCSQTLTGRGLMLYVCKGVNYHNPAIQEVECEFGASPTKEQDCNVLPTIAMNGHYVIATDQNEGAVTYVYQETNGMDGLQRGGSGLGVLDPCFTGPSPDTLLGGLGAGVAAQPLPV